MKKTLKVLAVFLTLLQLTAFAASAANEKSPFADVKTSRWSYANIIYCFENGLMNGVGDGKFDPTGKTTRAMITTILYRIAVNNGFTEEIKGIRSFADVERNQWYGPAVTWAKRSGVVNGYEGNIFKPNDAVTREQMAAMIVRFEEYCGYITDNKSDLTGFPDYKKIHDYALDSLAWVNAAGIITGTTASDNKTVILDPRGNATREQVAAILQRYCEMEHLEYATPKMISSYTLPVYGDITDAEVFVSTQGNDANPGTKEEPVKTIAKAQEIVKEIISGGSVLPEPGEIVIAIEAGTYPNPLVFEEYNSGNEDNPVKYIGYGGEVIIGGGIQIPSSAYKDLGPDDALMFSEDNLSHIKKVNLSEFTDVSSLPGDISVYSGDSALIIARYPNTDANGNDVFLKNNRHPQWYEEMDPDIKYDRVAYGYVNEHTITLGTEVQPRAEKYHTGNNIRVKSYFAYDWASDDAYATYDKESNVLEIHSGNLSGEYGVNYVCNGRYYLYNISEELDSSNEYFYEPSTGTLYFYDPSDKGCSVATGGDAITLNGAKYLTFENITVANIAGNGFTKNGSIDHITIKNCTIKNIRENGIKFNASSDYRRSHKIYKDPATNITVQGCEVYNIGVRGIYVHGGERDTLTEANNLIDNNSVHNFAQRETTYRAGIDVDGCGVTVSHNEVYDCPHYAIFYEDGNEIMIEKNYIHDAVKNTGDMGAIYSGRRFSNYGVTIRYNVIADIGFSEINRCGNGIYLDDELSGQEIYGNILYNVSGTCFLAGGRDNTIRSNIMIHTRDCTGYDSYNDSHESENCIHYYNGITAEFEEYAKNSTLTGEALFLDFANNTETERGNMIELWPSLNDFDFRNGVWAEKYPQLAGLSVNADDIGSKDFILNIGNVIVRDNFEIGKRKIVLSDNIEKFGGTAVNNQQLSINSAVWFKDAAHGDYTILPNNIIDDVILIPYGEIGRY